jgi:hypothetical protein
MKSMIRTLILLCLTLTITGPLMAQAPQKFKYQAVARDNAGNVIANQQVSFLITIRDGSPIGPDVYHETHDVTTNQFGLITLDIGNGMYEAGVFAAINWASGNKYLEIGLDTDGPTGGYIFVNMGIVQLLSVPYALYAAQAGNGGTTGPAGPQGPQGIQGQAGATGLQGPTGDPGPQGSAGTAGVTGAVGPQGLQGTTGPAGVQGPQGVQGTTGTQGLQGLQGPAGFTGAQGPQGVAGATGPIGPQGLQGPGGATGLQGDQGLIGPTGPQGQQGIQGQAGTNGVTGSQGPAGAMGSTGPKGATGPTGGFLPHYIGENFGGGIVFYTWDGGYHGLIAATSDQSTYAQWYNNVYRQTGAGGDGLNAGQMNTALIIATQMSDNQNGNFAAKICADYTVTVDNITYGDWYLPSKYELNLLFLQKDIVGGFQNDLYWSSTQFDVNLAWNQSFFLGVQSYFNYKYNSFYVRAIRSF